MLNLGTTTANGGRRIECWLQVPIMTSRGALTRVGHLLLHVPEGSGDALYSNLRPTLQLQPVVFAAWMVTLSWGDRGQRH